MGIRCLPTAHGSACRTLPRNERGKRHLATCSAYALGPDGIYEKDAICWF